MDGDVMSEDARRDEMRNVTKRATRRDKTRDNRV
jgi:hypothetical protein